MDNFKKVIIVIIIIALILSIVLLTLLQKELNTNEIESVTEEDINYKDFEEDYTDNIEVTKISNKKMYYTMKEL